MTRINTNVSSLNAQKTLAKNQAALQTSMTRLSTGLRINTGADDPSGMIAAAIQSNDIAAMKQAITNTQNGTMLINTADSALGQITNLLTDIRGLATQVGNTAVVDADMIAANQLQVDSAIQAIDRISQVTKFQGQQILNGNLDFINTAQTIPQISNLNVTQANLGTTGELGVTVQVTAHAERADITTSSGEQQATTALTFGARTHLYSGAGVNQVWLQAKSNSSEYDGVKFVYNESTTAPVGGSAAYDAVSKTITFTGLAAATFTQAVAAINRDIGDLFVANGEGAAAVKGTAISNTLHQVSMDITANAKGLDFNNVTVKMASSTTAAATPQASYNQDAKVLTITVNNGTTGPTAADRLTDSTTFADIVSAINLVTLNDGTRAFTATYPTTGGAATDRVFGMVSTDTAAVASTSVSGYMNSAFSAATRATGTISLAAGANLTQKSMEYQWGAGAAQKLQISLTNPGTGSPDHVHLVVGGPAGASASYDDSTHTLTITSLAGDTLGALMTAINTSTNASGMFTATNLSTDPTTTNTRASVAGTGNTVTATQSLDIKSTLLSGTADNVKITFHNDATAKGQETAVYDALKKTLDIHIVTGAAAAASSLTEIVNAINASTDATTHAATGAWKATNLVPAVTTGFEFTPSSFYTSTDTISVQALNSGANYNNMQVKFETVSSLSGGVNAVAGYDQANNIFTIQVKNSEAAADAVSLQDISDAISQVSGFAGSYVTKSAAGSSQSSGIIFGKSIDTTAVGNTGSTGGNTLLADLALEVGANEGQQVFTFKAGASANQVAAAINSASDSIGVVAYMDNGLVDLKSAAYGANGFISLNVISEGAGGLFKSSVSAYRATGTNANATINGIQADSNGNLLSINTASLAMNMNLAAETNGNFNFSITGGGAQFQLGPDVVSNQQLRIGIQSVNSARLGGVSGYLYQLGSGNNASLQTNANLAAKIVDEAGTAITSLRGRLGAISGLTMATNQNTLTDMVQNSETSLSLIQDTDFAAETANLTRAQILSQANMTVLSIANQQPQQVLSLLPRG